MVDHKNKEPGDLLTYAEVAKRLKVEVCTLYRWVRESRIPHVRLGTRVVRFDPAELRKWARAHRAGPPAPTEEAQVH